MWDPDLFARGDAALKNRLITEAKACVQPGEPLREV